MGKKRSLPFKVLGILLVLCTVFAVATITAVLAADAYPSKPLRLIIPWEPGGSADLVGRYIAAKLSESLGQQVVCENRAGATGVIGSEIVARAVPDGYTLLFVQAAFTLQPAIDKNLPFDAVKSFAPIARMGSAASAFVVHPSVPANSVKEFIALAKQKPGQLTFASGGYGGSNHMGSLLFTMKAGIDCKFVMFKGGSGPGIIDVLGGHSNAIIVTIPTVLSHIKAGKLRALATTGRKRSAVLPDVPTVMETLPDYEKVQWWGIHAPAKTPAPIVERLTKEIQKILSQKETEEFFQKQGGEADYMDPAEFGKFIEAEIDEWSEFIKKSNIKLK